MSDVKSQVISIIVDKLGVDEGEVTNEASFTNDLGADSLDSVEIIMSLEEKYNIKISEDVFADIHTVQDIVNYINDTVR